VDLRAHIEIHEAKSISVVDDRLRHVENALPAILDAKWTGDSPRWKLVVVPFKEEPPIHSTNVASCFIAFSYSHALGDGISGLAFHRSFLAALRSTYNKVQVGNDLTMASPNHPTPALFETPERLPISWSFLLSPFLAVYLPEFISSALGMRASVSSTTSGTWTATPIFFDPKNHHTAVKVLKIDAPTLGNALKECRRHNTKLTAFMHQMIVKAINQNIPMGAGIDNFASTTAINLRNAAGISNDEMGLFVSGFNDLHSRGLNNEDSWRFASTMSDKLGTFARTLRDQPIGLLRFLPSIRSWTASKLGEKRDCSYEVSNLLAFDPASPEPPEPTNDQDMCTIEEMIFAQPANVVGAPLVFNIVSVKEGNLICTVSWQIGAISGDEEDEQALVENVCRSIDESFHEMA
jgi:hypothetical protein